VDKVPAEFGQMRKCFLIVTAFGEVGTGLFLLLQPARVVTLLLGSSSAAPETCAVARVTGAALLSIGIACWLARNDGSGPAQRGLLGGVFVYDTGVALALAYSGAVAHLVGIALWPAVAVHAALAAWCAAYLRPIQGPPDP
jgi:hypothetical protein